MNFVGFTTLINKEVSRCLNVYLQTIIAPVITTLLFYIVFATVFVDSGREVFDLPFMVFLAPGLVMMSMAQNAFANTSSSLVIGKIQNNLNDILMAPLTDAEVLAAYMIGGVVRGMLIGVLSILILLFFIEVPLSSILTVLVFGILGCSMMALLGVVGGIWSEKFDHIAGISNFIVTPLTYLSGTFYSVGRLGDFWAGIAQFNPFFYMIDGFRSGFIGVSDSNLLTGLLVLLGCNAALWFAGYRMIKSGYKIKS